MFTGLVTDIAVVQAVARAEHGARLRLRPLHETRFVRGESVAVNGVCLTVLPDDDGALTADLSPETLRRTNLGSVAAGDALNLERSLAIGDRLGGHLVQGHVDTTGVLTAIRTEGDFASYRWSVAHEFRHLFVSKGSVTVNGISLTVIEPDDNSFGAALVPETLQKTNLRYARIGDVVNVEFDVMAKYAQRLFEAYLPRQRNH